MSSSPSNWLENIGDAVEDLGDWALAGGKTNTPKKPKGPVVDQEVEEAARRQAELIRRRRGRRSTIVTGPVGIIEPPKTRKTTLG